MSATLPELVRMLAGLQLEEREVQARRAGCEAEIHRVAVNGGLVSQPAFDNPQQFVCAGKVVGLTVRKGEPLVTLQEIGSLPHVDEPVQSPGIASSERTRLSSPLEVGKES